MLTLPLMWRRVLWTLVVCAALVSGAVWPGAGLAQLFGDVDENGVADARDIQRVINCALDISAEGAVVCDVNLDGVTNALDVQLVINVRLGYPGGILRVPPSSAREAPPRGSYLRWLLARWRLRAAERIG